MQKFGAAAKIYARLKTSRKAIGFWCSDLSVLFAFRLNLSTVYRNDFLHTPCRLLSALLCPDMPLEVVPLVSDNQQGCEGNKLRFLRNDVWEENDYLKMASGNAIQQIIRIRLNMASQRMNYKAKYKNDFMCPLCKKEEDTTEHVLTCEEMREHKYTKNDLYDTGDAAKWAKIIQLFQTNEKLRWDQESHS